jgi:hypothetical protein
MGYMVQKYQSFLAVFLQAYCTGRIKYVTHPYNGVWMSTLQQVYEECLKDTDLQPILMSKCIHKRWSFQGL